MMFVFGRTADSEEKYYCTLNRCFKATVWFSLQINYNNFNNWQKQTLIIFNMKYVQSV